MNKGHADLFEFLMDIANHQDLGDKVGLILRQAAWKIRIAGNREAMEAEKAAPPIEGEVEGWQSPETRGDGCSVIVRLNDDIAEELPLGARVTLSTAQAEGNARRQYAHFTRTQLPPEPRRIDPVEYTPEPGGSLIDDAEAAIGVLGDARAALPPELQGCPPYTPIEIAVDPIKGIVLPPEPRRIPIEHSR